MFCFGVGFRRLGVSLCSLLVYDSSRKQLWEAAMTLKTESTPAVPEAQEDTYIL